MTLAESIFLFIMFVCVFAAVMFSNKAIEDLQYHIDLIKETDLEVARTVDNNFDITDCQIDALQKVDLEFARTLDRNFDILNRQIEALKGPIYGPMLEDDE